ncbi:tRNA (guanine(37)-N1)-methyltransferase-like protein, partial [Sarcoptes scabiei]
MISTSVNSDTKLIKPASKLICPPDDVRGMKVLDRESFRKTVSIPFLKIKTSNLVPVTRKLRPYLLKLKNFKSVQQLDISQEPNHDSLNKVFLNPDSFDAKIPQLIEELQTSNLISRSIEYESLELNYENFQYYDIFQSVFDEGALTSFSVIGHILHLNLRTHHLPYRKLIGQMEILAQDDRDAQPNTNVSVCEAGIKFKFDFAKVYWNPRLSTERKRIIDLLNHKVDIVYDVFAGVGPFAVPIAKIRKCKVLANDLNPDAYHWLKENVALNKVENLVECFNLDGREFIKNQIKFDIIKQMEEFNGTNLNRRLHVLMNLPELALDFLKEFDGLLSSIENVHDKFVPDILVIHCYCFLRNISNPSEYLIDLVS